MFRDCSADYLIMMVEIHDNLRLILPRKKGRNYMKNKGRLNTKISIMIIITMFFQLLGPITSNISAHSEDSFRVVDEWIDNDKAYLDWEFDLDMTDMADEFNYIGKFTLESTIEEQLIANDGTTIGRYSIDNNGTVTVKINHELYEELGEEPIVSDEELEEEPIVSDEELEEEHLTNFGNNPDEEIEFEDVGKPETFDGLEAEGIENIADTENAENTENTESTESTESTENTGAVDGIDIESREGTDGVADVVNVEDIEGQEYILVVDSAEYVEVKAFSGTIVVDGVKEKEGLIDKFMGIMPLNMMMPLGGGSGFEMVVSPSAIHTIIAKQGGANGTEIQTITDYRPKIGDQLWVAFYFSLEHGHNYGNDATLEYELPNPLKAVSGSGALRDENNVEYANFSVDGNGKVIILFNENIRQKNIDGEDIGGLGINEGYFGITAEFYPSNTELSHNLELPNSKENSGSINIPIYFKPTGGSALTKAVNPTSGRNVKELTWTVNINTEMNDLGTGGKKFKDTLTDNKGNNHKFKAGSLVVKKYKLGNDGETRTNETDVTSNFTQLTGSETNNSFELNLTEQFAYEITYVTIPGDTEDASQTVKNNATFPGASPINKSVTITYGKPLEKTGNAVSGSGVARGTTDWTIVVNANEKTIASGTTITDTWSSGHKLQGNVNDITVSGADITSDDYSIALTTTDGFIRGFILTLNKQIETEFTIEYTTELSDSNKVIYQNSPIINEVVRSDRTDVVSDRKKTISYDQNILKKSYSNLNYQNKTVDWTITINSANYNMQNILLEDKFTNGNLKIKDGTFVVKKGSTILTTSDYTLTPSGIDGKDGFNLSIPNTGGSTDIFTITYTTDYDIKDADDPTSPVYENKAQVSWETNVTSYTSPWINSQVEINDQQKANGYKDGYYNYRDKIFQWEIGINYNFDNITTPTFKDTLPVSQIIDRDSIKVYNLDLTGGGNGVTIGEALVEGTDYTLTPVTLANTFTIEFINSINSPYRIVYTSKTEYNYYEPQANNHKVKNEAQLFDNAVLRSNWAKEVEVQHTNKLVDKSFEQDGGKTGSGSAKTSWLIKLNWGQSTLLGDYPNNPLTITDTVGKDSDDNPNQMIYKDSFKITEMNFTNNDGKNATPIKGEEHLPGGDLYDVEFGTPSDDWTFKIKFKQNLSKAYNIEYDSYYLGANNTNIQNTAILSYKYNSSDDSGDSFKDATENYSVTFKYFGGASATKGKIKIIKKDSDDNNINLAGAKFQLWNTASGGVLIEEIITDANGEAEFSLKLGYGDYYLIETEAPAFYDIASSSYQQRKKVTLDADLDANGVTVTNKKFKQSVELTKIAAHKDEYNNDIVLSGVKFKLEKMNGAIVEQVIGEYTTDAQGKIFVDELLPGNYQFIELETLEHYQLDNAPRSFTITAGQNATESITVKNTKLADIQVKKVDKDDNNKTLAGAIFELIDSTSTSIAQTIATAIDGIARFFNIPYGTYTIKEATAPDGYVAGEDTTITIGDDNNINLSGNESIIAKTITNAAIHQAVKLTKTDSADSSIKLSGSVFTLHKASDDSQITEDQSNNSIGASYITSSGNEITNTFTTNSSGELTVNNLPAGKYYFKEIEAPKYYLLPTDEDELKSAEFEIKENQTTITEVMVDNTRGEGSVTVIKLDADDNTPIENVEFTIKEGNNSGDGIVKTTNSSGQAIFSNLPYGQYTIEETSTPNEYAPSEEIVTVELIASDNNYSQEVTIYNKKKDHSVQLTKYNSNKTRKLAGAEFELKKKDDTDQYQLVDSIDKSDLTTNEDGVIHIELEVGEYQLIETKAPSGYRLDATPIEFSIEENQTEPMVLEKTNNQIYTGGGGGGGGTPPEPPKLEEPKPEQPKPEEPKPEQPKPEEPKPEEPKKPEEPFKPTKVEKTEDGKPVLKPKDVITPIKLIEKPVGNNGSNNGNDGDNKRVPYDPETGIVDTDELEPNVPHEFVVITEIEGKELVVGKVTITVDEDGNVTVEEELIDPYGTVTDCKTNKPAGDVELTLFFADTERNRAKGIVPGTLVELPIVEGFMPNHNKNPQVSTHDLVWSDETSDHGNYGWLVFPESDYYIVAKGKTCETYISETISVEWDIIKHDIKMPHIQMDAIDKLPKTGEGSRLPYYLTGIILIALGLFARKKKIV